jgi:hypothetical protein
MSFPKKRLHLWLWAFTIFLFLINTKLFANNWDLIVPQESLTKEVRSGNITPNQFQGLQNVSAQELLSRENVQNLLRDQFEILGEYGETKNGLILQNTKDWERFGKSVGFNGATMQRVYEFWITNKKTNREQFLQTEVPNISQFFEGNLSTKEEGLLNNGEPINWHKLAEKKGLPVFIVAILIAMYGIWWRKKEYENDEFGGFKEIYEIVAKKFSSNWGVFYKKTYFEVEKRKNNLLSDLDSRFVAKEISISEHEQQRKEIFEKFSKWNIKALDFIKERTITEEGTSKLKKMSQQIISKISDYPYLKKAKQKIEFDKFLAKITEEFSEEELETVSNGTFQNEKRLNQTAEKLKFREEFMEKIDYVTPVANLFSMKFAPVGPEKEAVELNLEKLTELFPDFSKNQIETDKYAKEIQYYESRLKNLPDDQHYWRNIWLGKLANAKAEFEKNQKVLEISKKEIKPLKKLLQADYEAYSDTAFTYYEAQAAKLTAVHQERIKIATKKWESFSKSYRESTRKWAAENIENETEISKAQLNDELSSLQKSADFLLQMKAMTEKDRGIRKTFNNSQKQKRTEYEQKRIKNPVKENIINYLQNLAQANSQPYFSNEQKNILNTQKIQDEIKKLNTEINAPSLYSKEIKELQKDLVCNQYTFTEYLNRNSNLKTRSATKYGWVIKDEWMRNKQKIGRNGDYWQQRHAKYSQILIATRTEYDPQKIKVLEKYARKAHQEMLDSYDGWEKYFKIHPLLDSVQKESLNTQINKLNSAETERKKIISEQIAVLEKEAKNLLSSSFDSARWLSETIQERNESVVTNKILLAKIENDFGITKKINDSQNLITHFSEVRENEDTERAKVLEEIVPKLNNPFIFNFEKMVAPAIKSMKYYSTSAGRARKEAQERNLSYLKIPTKSRISKKNPIIYERNEDGTYTAFSRETGEKIAEGNGIITQTTNLIINNSNTKALSTSDLVQTVEKIITEDVSFTPLEISKTMATTATIPETAEKIIAKEKESILELGDQAQLEALLESMTTEERNAFNIKQIKAALASGAKVFFVARNTQAPFGIHTFIRVEPNDPNAKPFTLGGYNSDSDLSSMFSNKLVKNINDLSDVKITEEDALLWEEISDPTEIDNKETVKNILESFFEYENDREYYTAGQQLDYYSANCNNFANGLLKSAGVPNQTITKWHEELDKKGEDWGFGKSLEEMMPDFVVDTEIK